MDEESRKQEARGFLLGGRLIPIKREGNKVFARTLRFGEEDKGETVHLNAGDQLIIPAGELVINSRAIDADVKKGLGGYAPVANTVWTWYRIVGEELGYFLFLFSLARRIDSTHLLWTHAIGELEDARTKYGIPERMGFYGALGVAEATIIALHRGIDMAFSLIDQFSLDIEISDNIESIRNTIKEMRDAFEHIDSRAKGRVGMQEKEDPDALTIFSQPDFMESGILSYKEYSLNFHDDIIEVLLQCREFIMQTIDARVKSKTTEEN